MAKLGASKVSSTTYGKTTAATITKSMGSQNGLLARNPDYDDDYNSNVDSHINDYDLRTDFNVDEPFYRAGGKRDPDLTCSFSCTALDPPSITLPLSPTGVSWDYNIRTQTFNTIGGQVVQILGVDISNLTIQGYFGFERWFGVKDMGRQGLVSGHQSSPSTNYKWQTDPKFHNGLVQMATWFRSYFNLITQGGNFDLHPMTFSYPHRGWKWIIRPKEFPRVRFSHDEVAPMWELHADMIEYLQNHFIKGQLNAKIREDLAGINTGVGKFTEFLKYSENINTANSNLEAEAKKLGGRYGDYIKTFDNSEVTTLIGRGYSYPTLGETAITNQA